MTSVYLHARPGSSSALDLDEGIFGWKKLAMDAIEGGKKTIFSKQEADQIYGQLERIEQRFTQLITEARSRRTQTHGTATSWVAHFGALHAAGDVGICFDGNYRRP